MSSKTKIVKFIGGLGNQMFQYALAKAMEEKIGANVLFDISSYAKAQKTIVGDSGKDKNGLCIRQYEINIFRNADIKLASDIQTLGVKISNLVGISKKYKEKDAFNYNEKIFTDDKYNYFSGYFQNEKYFKFIKKRLIKDFKLPALREDDKYNKELLDEIQKSNNPVFIHVRRDDYIKLGYSISLDYYKKAVQHIKIHVENPTFFVFCAEDTEYIKNEFNIGVDFKLVGEKNKTRETFFENMRLMKACKHAIIANSSYSWWAAWLNEFEDKIVIAPSPWMNGSDEIICDSWIKIGINNEN